MSRTDISRQTKAASQKVLENYPKIAALHRDPRGLPIPVNVRVNPHTRKPNFAFRDICKEIGLICDGKCSVTGTPLDLEDVWFVTSPDLAFVPLGLPREAPMCGEAKNFTLQVCPYFGVSGYARLSNDQANAMAPGVLQSNETIDPITPLQFVAIKVSGFSFVPRPSELRYVPDRNFKEVELWANRALVQTLAEHETRAKLTAARDRALECEPESEWPEWSKPSIDGSLTDNWPWKTPNAKTVMLQYAAQLYGD